MTLLHKCRKELPTDEKHGYGSAITSCWELQDGTLHVDNEEYHSQVDYCPWCGYEAKVKVKYE